MKNDEKKSEREKLFLFLSARPQLHTCSAERRKMTMFFKKSIERKKPTWKFPSLLQGHVKLRIGKKLPFDSLQQPLVTHKLVIKISVC